MREVELYTDGSSLARTREGGIGFVIIENRILKYKFFKGFDNLKTGQAELLAIYYALKHCPRNVDSITLYSDSQYAIKSFTEWWTKWELLGFLGVKNEELLRAVKKELDSFPIKIHLKHVKGHRGNIYNEMADVLAHQGRISKKRDIFNPQSFHLKLKEV